MNVVTLNDSDLFSKFFLLILAPWLRIGQLHSLPVDCVNKDNRIKVIFTVIFVKGE